MRRSILLVSSVLGFITLVHPLTILTSIYFNLPVYDILPVSFAICISYIVNLYYGLNLKDMVLRLFIKLSDTEQDVKGVLSYVSGQIWDKYLAETNHITSIGNVIFTNYSILTYIISLILILAMVGAITIVAKSQISEENAPIVPTTPYNDYGDSKNGGALNVQDTDAFNKKCEDPLIKLIIILYSKTNKKFVSIKERESLDPYFLIDSHFTGKEIRRVLRDMDLDYEFLDSIEKMLSDPSFDESIWDENIYTKDRLNEALNKSKSIKKNNLLRYTPSSSALKESVYKKLSFLTPGFTGNPLDSALWTYPVDRMFCMDLNYMTPLIFLNTWKLNSYMFILEFNILIKAKLHIDNKNSSSFNTRLHKETHKAYRMWQDRQLVIQNDSCCNASFPEYISDYTDDSVYNREICEDLFYVVLNILLAIKITNYVNKYNKNKVDFDLTMFFKEIRLLLEEHKLEYHEGYACLQELRVSEVKDWNEQDFLKFIQDYNKQMIYLKDIHQQVTNIMNKD